MLRTQLHTDYFQDLFDKCVEFGVDIEAHRTSPLLFRHTSMIIDVAASDTETGPGVFETALAYCSALRMADNAILFKFAAKSLGMKHGVLPSFMAKPWGNVSTRFAPKQETSPKPSH
jgi:glutamine synthetase